MTFFFFNFILSEINSCFCFSACLQDDFDEILDFLGGGSSGPKMRIAHKPKAVRHLLWYQLLASCISRFICSLVLFALQQSPSGSQGKATVKAEASKKVSINPLWYQMMLFLPSRCISLLLLFALQTSPSRSETTMPVLTGHQPKPQENQAADAQPGPSGNPKAPKKVRMNVPICNIRNN